MVTSRESTNGVILVSDAVPLITPRYAEGMSTVASTVPLRVIFVFSDKYTDGTVGNITLAQEVVHRIWDQHDAGMFRSWEWMKQLRSHGVNFLVT